MILVVGPLFSGKRAYAASLGYDESQIKVVEWDEPIPGDLSAFAQDLANRYPVIVVTEVGCGIVPLDPQERRQREAAGRLNCFLASAADSVIRLYCGIPSVLKGALPCTSI